jgi:FkbM family methyltransferase
MLSSVWESVITRAVKVLPNQFITLIIRIIPPVLLAKLIGSLSSLKTYPISIFGIDFLLESGPRDDHYLDLEKNQIQKWEKEVLSIWKDEVTGAQIVIDVGAYLGIYSILAAKLGVARVLAIEPNLYSAKQLNRNLVMNQVVNSVEVLQVAVGATKKIVSVISPHNRPYSSATQIKDSPTSRSLKSWTHTEKVSMVTLDSILSDSNQRVSAIKIDAEGYEYFILEGAVKILSQSSLALIIEILTKPQKKEIDNFLSGFGYPSGLPIEISIAPTNYIYKVAQSL